MNGSGDLSFEDLREEVVRLKAMIEAEKSQRQSTETVRKLEEEKAKLEEVRRAEERRQKHETNQSILAFLKPIDEHLSMTTQRVDKTSRCLLLVDKLSLFLSISSSLGTHFASKEQNNKEVLDMIESIRARFAGEIQNLYDVLLDTENE